MLAKADWNSCKIAGSVRLQSKNLPEKFWKGIRHEPLVLLLLKFKPDVGMLRLKCLAAPDIKRDIEFFVRALRAVPCKVSELIVVDIFSVIGKINDQCIFVFESFRDFPDNIIRIEDGVVVLSPHLLSIGRNVRLDAFILCRESFELIRAAVFRPLMAAHEMQEDKLPLSSCFQLLVEKRQERFVVDRIAVGICRSGMREFVGIAFARDDFSKLPMTPTFS